MTQPLSGGETELGQWKDGETHWCKQVPGLQEGKKKKKKKNLRGKEYKIRYELGKRLQQIRKFKKLRNTKKSHKIQKKKIHKIFVNLLSDISI